MSCTDCEFHQDCKTNKMDGIGNSRAKIMLVGDSPSATDDSDGEPYSGDAGEKLTYLLKRAGLKRRDVFITNSIKCKPGNPNLIKKVHTMACQKHLFQEIVEREPAVVIAMGNRPLESLLNEKATKDFRGHMFSFELDVGRKEDLKTWVIPTYSPNASLTKWEFDDLIVHDLKKAKEYVKTKQLPKPLKVKVDYVTNLKQLKRVTKQLIKSKQFTFDLETTGLSFVEHEIIQAGFCTKPGQAIVIPFCEYDMNLHAKKWDTRNIKQAEKVNLFVGKHKEKIREALKEIFASKAKKIAHNGKFDVKFLRWNKIPIVKWTHDTIILHSLYDENKPHGLTFLLEWFGINHFSDNRDEGFGPYEHDLWPFVNKTKANRKPYTFAPPFLLADYLARDCDGTMRLFKKTKALVKKEGLWDLYMKQQMPLAKAMADLEFQGIKLQIEGLQKIAKRFSSHLDKIEKQLRKMSKNKTLNLNSPKQILEYFESIDTPLEKKTKSQQSFSTDGSVLTALARSRRKYGKFARLLLEHREITKLKGTYLDGKDGFGGMLQHTDSKNFVHASWNIHTPRTGRMSCSDPNLQQIPRPNPKYPWANIRQLFHPSKKDWVMFSIDYKQLEMRVVAYLARDMTMLREFQKDVDIHTRNAVMFGKVLGFLPDDMTEKKFAKIRSYKKPKNYEKLPSKDKIKIDVKVQLAGEYDEFRTLAKALGFGTNYGLTAGTLAKDYDKEADDVQELMDAYFEKYDGINDWREQVKLDAFEKGVLTLPQTGRKRRFKSAAKWFNSPFSQDIRKRAMDMQQIENQAMNFPVQGFANEIFTQGKLKFYKALKKEAMKSRIMLSLHDGVLGEGPIEEMAHVEQIAQKTMVKILSKGKKHEVCLGVDFDVYKTWNGEKVENYGNQIKLRKAA